MLKAYIPNTADRYWIDETGRVYDTLRKCYTALSDDSNGYLCCGIRLEDGNWKTVRPHRLVGELLLEGQSVERCVINHIDEDKHNNNLKNLEWATRSENTRHHGAHLRSAAHRSKRVLVCKPDNSFAKIFDSESSAIRELGVNAWNASGAIRGRRRSAGGYLWRAL